MPETVVRQVRGWDHGRLRRVGIATAAGVFALVAFQTFGRTYVFFDMKIYHGAVTWWASGGELYRFVSPGSGLGFTYPPFAALAMLPMVGFAATVAGWLNALASVAALAVVLAALVLPVARRCGWPGWLTVTVAVALAVPLEPVRETLGFGQINLFLFALVLADLAALRWRTAGVVRGEGRLARLLFSGAWAGAGIGLATAVKLTPALFIVYLVVVRQWRPAMVAAGTAAGAGAGAAMLAPRESLAYFTGVLWQTDRVGSAAATPNQSLAGVLARLYDSPDAPGLLWFAFAAVFCALGLSRAAAAHGAGDELAAFTLVGLTANVISPISWTHHLVFVVPAVLILVDAALRRRAAGHGLGVGTALSGARHALAAVATYVLFLLAPVWWHAGRLPEISHYAYGLWGLLTENSLAIAVMILVAALPGRPGAEPVLSGDAVAVVRRKVLVGS